MAVTIHGHSNYGTAATGDDGGFTLPVAGGGFLTVVFKMEGRITSHRQVYVGWNDYGIVETIRMLPVDPVATAVVFDGNPATVFEPLIPIPANSMTAGERYIAPDRTTDELRAPGGSQ